MKTPSENVHYFSAYPLKALNLPEEEYQSELNIHQETKLTSRIRILPMVNPYKEQDFLQDHDKQTVFNLKVPVAVPAH